MGSRWNTSRSSAGAIEAIRQLAGSRPKGLSGLGILHQVDLLKDTHGPSNDKPPGLFIIKSADEPKNGLDHGEYLRILWRDTSLEHDEILPRHIEHLLETGQLLVDRGRSRMAPLDRHACHAT